MVTGYNKKKEMSRMFREVDEGEDHQEMMSSIDIQGIDNSSINTYFPISMSI